jgi:hypothetical protein
MAVCRDPDEIKLYYFAGAQEDQWLKGMSYDPLSRYFAQAIAWMATARLEREICGCGNLIALFRNLRQDLAVTREGGASRFTPDEILNNPFGTKMGEVMAWQRISKLTDSISIGGAIG